VLCNRRHGTGISRENLLVWARNKLARKNKSVARLILLALRHQSVFDLSVYACPGLFQTVDIAIGVARSPAMALQLFGGVWQVVSLHDDMRIPSH
jgi:hypothetical protein